MRLTGRTILITGGSAGIGLAFARKFLELGNEVIVTGRRRSALDAVKAQHSRLYTIQNDAGDPAQTAALAARIKADFPALDVLMNNAGVGVAKNLKTTADTTADTTVDTETPSAGSLIDAATAAGNFTTLLAAVEAAGLTEDLATNTYTLLAPTDEAFAALGQPAIDALLADPAQLTALLQNHLLPLDQTARSISIFSKVVTVAGNSLAVTKDGDTVTVGGATIVQPDITADNGFLHGIDTVLVPAPAA